MRIGILGGTFDPVHFGHLNLASETRRLLKLDKVIFIPAKRPPHKKTALAAAPHRLNMLRLAICRRADFDVSLSEFLRRGKSYSVDTLKAMREQYAGNQLFFITGADSITELKTWKQIDKIFKLCTFVVAARPGFEIKKLTSRIKTIAIRPRDIASHEIRARIRKGLPIKGLVPAAVENYIRSHKLYQAKHGQSGRE